MLNNDLTLSRAQVAERTFMTRVFGWMALGLAVTGFTAWLTLTTPSLARFVLGSRGVFFGLIIGELLLVIYLSAAVRRMSSSTAIATFLFYAAVNGLTLSIIMFVYTMSSIASTFFVTAGTFGAMFALGYTTKMDLTRIGSLCGMALIGFILASLANLFLHSSGIYWVTTYIGILIFVGLTAYDAQKIKAMHLAGVEGSEEDEKAAVLGALALYLDFINLFLLILRLMGGRRR